MDPILGALIAALVHEVATRGFDLLRERSATSVYHPVVEPVQLHSGTRAMTQVHIDLPVLRGDYWQLGQTPYWLLLGIQNRSGERYEVPALYGESIDLIVDSDQYDLAALFFTRPRNFNDLPTLRALASEHVLLMSRGLQSMSMFGRYPNDQEIAWLAKQAPLSGLRFRLPPTSSQVISTYQRAAAALPGLRTPAHERLIENIRRSSRMTQSQAPMFRDSPIRGSLELPGAAARTPPQTPKKPSPAPVYDTTCQARTRRGQRCQNPAQSARTSVCDMHIGMVAAGKKVLWHHTGTPIELKKH